MQAKSCLANTVQAVTDCTLAQLQRTAMTFTHYACRNWAKARSESNVSESCNKPVTSSQHDVTMPCSNHMPHHRIYVSSTPTQNGNGIPKFWSRHAISLEAPMRARLRMLDIASWRRMTNVLR
eukprot:TRINITY_DN9172_c0_g1_i7.p1 TRINITY_DN9172_c0_g1~~TRINITY_DN9172_c0_g1_i7.p1  ORF type:complete len:134 (+),score=0.91 TRINITY_DN9172_c0_g1_i7:35-403(+)